MFIYLDKLLMKDYKAHNGRKTRKKGAPYVLDHGPDETRF